mmetsp:Transcript_45108/g.79374  ORF Transcript_45108/g.79374 Transcript_45108/m.79374 type:complete len:190 (-) Transcript_45108:85-654(-)
MPKVERGRTKYHDVAPRIEAPADEEEASEEEAGPADAPETGADLSTGEGAGAVSRGQRKRQKRRENFMRKFEFVNFVQKQEQARRDGGLANLGEMAGSLDEVLAAGAQQQSSASRPLSRKAKTASDEREMAQYSGVLGYQAFKQDPLGALEQHLRNSIQRQKENDAGSGDAAPSSASAHQAGKKRRRAG